MSLLSEMSTSAGARWAFLLVLFTVFASCGGDDVAPSEDSDGDTVRFEQPTPTDNNDDDTCSGCVDDEDACQSGDSEDACGDGGAVCTACEGDEQCVDGGCAVPMSDVCDPDTCDGCCTAEGNCVNGGANDLCGVGGGACRECDAGSDCNAGVCEGETPDPCGPANCAGCCDRTGSCVGGTEAAACGAGGGQCTDCAASGAACNAGACDMPQPTCATTCQGCCVGEMCVTATDAAQCGVSGAACVACGTDEMCGGTGCVPNPPTGDRWQIVVSSASIPSTKISGASWDPFGGYPDVVTGVAAEDPVTGAYAEGYTTIAYDELNPVWNEVTITNLTDASLANGVYFWLFDDEGFPDDICLQVEIVDVSAIVPGQDIVTTCDDDAWVDWTWRIERYSP